MQKFMKRCVMAVIIACMALQAFALTKKIDGIKYGVIGNNEVEVMGIVGEPKSSIVIPETVEIKGTSYRVVGIGYAAFRVMLFATPDSQGRLPQEIFKIKSISLPESVRYIKEAAFEHCAGLKDIVLPDLLQTIGESAFSNCRSLEKVVIPDGIREIGESAFSGCSSLQEVVIPEGVRKIGGRAFSGCALKSLVLPNSVDTISSLAFSFCKYLTDVVVPDKAFVHTITSGSWDINPIFGACANITNVRGNTIPYPSYICEEWIRVQGGTDKFHKREFDDSCPFIREKLPLIKKTFSYFAYDRIMERMEEWEAKKEYETSAQWKERLTEAKRKAKLEEVKEQVRNEFIARHAPSKLDAALGTFDADYGVYPVEVKGMKTFYAQVPFEEASAFKENWNRVEMEPQYGVVDDHIGVLSCTFKLGDKTYRSTRNYTNDNIADMAVNLPPLEINLSENLSQPRQPSLKIDNALDIHIPKTETDNTETFAVIIGNENYQSVAHVPYARNDARIFAEYCQKTLGLPEKNIRTYSDATYGTLLEALSNIGNIAKAYKGDMNVIFYYAGHGIPNESSGDAYLLPVDASGRQTEVCYPLDRLYQKLGGLNARRVIVFIDACFSGAQRGNGMLASARGVAIKAKSATAQGNMVVFSAATGDETAYPYQEKGHGLFTYFLLKKLQESEGKATLGEISDYVSEQVARQSVVVNGKSQTPVVTPSASLSETWKDLRLR